MTKKDANTRHRKYFWKFMRVIDKLNITSDYNNIFIDVSMKRFEPS
jgi:hypothetical protein